MKKLLVFVGESGSGKTTLIAELVKRCPDKFKKVITCTSRLPRIGEMNKVDYHFLSAEYFINNPDLVLVKYVTNDACYGTRRADIRLDTHHLLLTSKPTGIQKLVELGFRNIIVVNIAISEVLKVMRMRQRGDSEKVIFERLKIDALTLAITDFGEVPVVDLNANQSLDEKIEIVLGAC